MTHGDADHIGGLQAVAEKFPIRRVIRNAHAPHTKLEKKLMETFHQRGTTIFVPPIGLSWELETGVKWQFLHPDPHHLLGDDQHSNDDSVVCLLWIYGKKVLMTGDIGVEAEREILSHWNVASIDVLKVAHHGSKYSTDEKWLEAIGAKEAVISVGAKNRYGHPTQEVLNRLRSFHVPVFRTDELGAVTYHFRPNRVDRESMLPTSFIIGS
jgi:competence protein ComEC